jgi:hypothetical protein
LDFLGEVATVVQPLIVLLDQQGADEADGRLVVGKDAVDVRSAPDLTVDPLQRIGGAQLGSVRCGEVAEGDQVLLSFLQELGE